MVLGGACVLCNLSPIVFMSKLRPGIRYNYVVTQCCLVNHLPFHLTSAWVVAWAECVLEKRVWERDGRTWKRASSPVGHACQLGCDDLRYCLQCSVFWGRGSDHHGPWSKPHLCSSPPHKQQWQHHIIRNNILNSLSQSEHCKSCNETFWQLPPWPRALALRVGWRKALSTYKRLTQTRNSLCQTSI